MTPMAAIVASTTSAAELLGIDSYLGSVQVGKAADLIAMPGDPIAGISSVERLSWVMKGGKIVERNPDA